MVNVSQDVINYFNEGNLQTAAIEFSNGKESFTITEADIIQGGLKIDRYSVTNSIKNTYSDGRKSSETSGISSCRELCVNK